MLARTARPLALAVPLSVAVLGPPVSLVPRRDVSREAVPVTGGAVEPRSAGVACPAAGLVCSDDARCRCPLSGQVSDAERAIMNGIARQAARLTTLALWFVALVALAALVLVMRP